MEAKFIKIEQDYENDLFSVKTGKKKSDYLGQVGKLVMSRAMRHKGIYDVEFEDGQRWSFMPSQLEFYRYGKREKQ